MKIIRYKYPTASSSNSLNCLFGSGSPSIGRFQKLFDEFLGVESPQDQLPADLYEDDQNFFVRLELPGVNKDEIDLELENSVLTCSRRHSEKTEDGKANYSFKHSMSVPKGVVSDQVFANYKDGILTVILPKKEASVPRRIKVK